MTHNQLTIGQNPYIASITREPFLFYEMRVAARLLYKGATDEEAVEQIVGDNLFQYPTEKSIKRMARACIKRLRNLEDDSVLSFAERTILPLRGGE